MVNAHTLEVSRTAHYYTIGTPSPKVTHVFFCLHGYGQLASQFIYKFDRYATDERLLFVAPEGLSRFYLDHKYDKIGASWMTRLDRQMDITDINRWLDTLFAATLSNVSPNVKITLLGFSQGALTVSRWMAMRQPRFNNLILWGAGYADDMDYLALKDYLSDKQSFLVRGHHDAILTEDIITTHREFMIAQALQPEVILFDGGHELDRSVWHDLMPKLLGED